MSSQFNEPIQIAIKPTLTVNNGEAALEFYKKAFDAIELMKIADTDGGIVAELSIGGANFFIADESPDHQNISPINRAKVSIRLGLIVPDPDAIALNAINAGATEVNAVADQPYGYRLGHIIDPFGHHWEIGRPIDV